MIKLIVTAALVLCMTLPSVYGEEISDTQHIDSYCQNPYAKYIIITLPDGTVIKTEHRTTQYTPSGGNSILVTIPNGNQSQLYEYICNKKQLTKITNYTIPRHRYANNIEVVYRDTNYIGLRYISSNTGEQFGLIIYDISQKQTIINQRYNILPKRKFDNIYTIVGLENKDILITLQGSDLIFTTYRFDNKTNKINKL